MTINHEVCRADSQSELLAGLLERYGEIMDGPALIALFRFPSDRAFRRAAAKGVLPIPTFRIPGRPGTFARTRDVAEWLMAVAPVSPLPTSPSQEVHSCSDANDT
jgi:hypothetical protein